MAAPSAHERRKTRERAAVLRTAVLGCVLAFGCSAPPPRLPNPTRPLEEVRAVELIRQAFRDEQDHGVPGALVALSETKQIKVDVAARDHKYGVAYVTAAERLELGSILPEKEQARGDALQLVSGLGADGDARVLVLRDSDYQYDDQVGDQRETPLLAAELKLKRDVQDFIVRAHVEKWP